MEQSTKEYLVQKVNELLRAPSCCEEAKAAAQAWLDALGTDSEQARAEALIAELEEDLIPIDGLIAFAGSAAGAQVFGKERAAQLEAHAREIKAAGASYCDCPACAAAAAILEKKTGFLG